MLRAAILPLVLLGCAAAPAPTIVPARAQPAAAAEAAPIDAARFLVGRWVGEGMGGRAEEVWSPPMGGQMVGHFTFAPEGKPKFYEIMLIRPNVDGKLEFLVKHFNADFTAWEEKDEWITFRAGSVGPGDRLDFKGLWLELEGDQLTAAVTMRGKDGSTRDVPFVMRRAD